MIEDYTTEELSAKIEAIKAEREKTANALKKYEEELERRKDKNWLPFRALPFDATFENTAFDELRCEIKMYAEFKNRSCFEKYVESWREVHQAWFANSKGEPIDIKVLLPLLPRGWVCMNEACVWVWCKEKPELINNNWTTSWKWNYLTPFNIKRAKDWRNSLVECGL